MAKGFTDSNGNFRPTGNSGGKSSKEKTVNPEGMIFAQELENAERAISNELRDALSSMRDRFLITTADIDDARIERTIKRTKFDDDAEEVAFRKGLDRGLFFGDGAIEGLDKTQVNSLVSEDLHVANPRIETENDLRDVAFDIAHEAEQNDRQVSPFEITAKEIDDSMFNEEGEQINEAFNQFEDGVSIGMSITINDAKIDRGLQ